MVTLNVDKRSKSLDEDGGAKGNVNAEKKHGLFGRLIQKQKDKKEKIADERVGGHISHPYRQWSDTAIEELIAPHIRIRQKSIRGHLQSSWPKQ